MKRLSCPAASRIIIAAGVLWGGIPYSSACCALTKDTKAVVNADQTVIMIWDEKAQIQHFIRQASFSSDAGDVGFMVPSPTRPELAEAGDAAFPRLREITAPISYSGGGSGFGCSKTVTRAMPASAVEVIEEKRVAGFDATVLKAGSAGALTDWLRDHGYSYSPAVAAWAQPYVENGWMMTALKVARAAGAKTAAPIQAAALRISFKTERPLFPYREPVSGAAAKQLGIKGRLLRIYFIADSRYRGEINGGFPWSGKLAWSGEITSERASLLKALTLPETTATGRWWLSEYEDNWAYTKAHGDLYFSKDKDQGVKVRTAAAVPPPYDATLIAFMTLGLLRVLPGRWLLNNVLPNSK